VSVELNKEFVVLNSIMRSVEANSHIS
jgi:hypothetical protein